MPLVPAKCPSCGGEIQVDDSRKEAFCTYCGNKFLVESAVSYYNTKNEYHIEHADIKMEDSSGLETKLRNAESYLVQHRDYEKAEKLFKTITEEFSDDWRGWWGTVRAMTRELAGIPSDGRHARAGYDRTSESVRAEAARALDIGRIQQVAERAFNVMDEDHLAQLRPAWEDFYRRSQAYIRDFADRTAQDFASCKEKNDRFLGQLRQLEQERERAGSQAAGYEQKTRKYLKNGNVYLPGIVIYAVLIVTALVLAAVKHWLWMVLIAVALTADMVFGIYRLGQLKTSQAEGKRFRDQQAQDAKQMEALRDQQSAQLGDGYEFPLEPFHTL